MGKNINIPIYRPLLFLCYIQIKSMFSKKLPKFSLADLCFNVCLRPHFPATVDYCVQHKVIKKVFLSSTLGLILTVVSSERFCGSSMTWRRVGLLITVNNMPEVKIRKLSYSTASRLNWLLTCIKLTDKFLTNSGQMMNDRYSYLSLPVNVLLRSCTLLKPGASSQQMLVHERSVLIPPTAGGSRINGQKGL